MVHGMGYDRRTCDIVSQLLQEVPTVVLPIVPLAIVVGSSITGGVGVAAGTAGGVQIWKAKKQIEVYEARYMKRRALHLAMVDSTTVALQTFGRTQALAKRDVIFRLRDFLELHGKKVRANEHLILDGVHGSNSQFQGMVTLDPDVVGWVGGLASSVAAGAATRVALLETAKQLAHASTGTRIKVLNGAAAERAIRAFFGGGSLAAGGGGMKLGNTMLNVATVGSSLIIAGVAVKSHGIKARTEADRQRSDVDVAIAQLDVRDEIHRGVQEWACEQNEVLSRLVSQATDALDVLESEPFNNTDLHAGRLQVALIFVTAVGQAMAVPDAGEDGNLDGNAEQITFKYRDKTTEATDD